jgi:predicted secreted protein
MPFGKAQPQHPKGTTMTKPNTILGTQLLLKVGNAGSPETFTHPCLINADRSIEFTAGGNKVEVPDCTNPDDPVWTEFVKQTLECALSGAGKLDAVGATIASYTTWLTSKDPKNVQIWLGTIGHWAGAFHLTKFGVTGTRGDKAEVSIGLDSDGAVTWTTATP